MNSSAVAAHAPQSSAQRLDRGFSVGALWALYTLTLRQHRHGKRWMVMALLMLLPVGLALLVRSTARDAPSIVLEFIFVFMFIPQAVLPLAALIYGSGIIRDELEEQTITYLLIRPIPKWALYIVKLLAAATVAIFLSIVFTALTYAMIYVGVDPHGLNIPLRCLAACSIHSLAVLAYCCLFGLISLITGRVLIAGIVYIALFEGLFANLAFGIRLLTVIYYTRLIAYHAMSFIVPTPYGSQDFAAETWQLDIQNDPKLLQHPQVATCLVVLLVGSLLCAVAGAFLCSRKEFHVKTPEKA
jgi:ABC-2 type transport system permease protein